MGQSMSDRPTYAAAFQCIGASCEDNCCHDWSIPVDQQTYEIYQRFPAGRLGATVSQFVSIADVGSPRTHYASINRAPSGFCPFFGPDQLCAMHKEYGPKVLPATCSIYPRALSLVDGVLEGSLNLSCPEAARNVLLAPEFMQVAGDLHSGAFRTDTFSRIADFREASGAARLFQAVRALLVHMVRDRMRPLWQRLLLMGAFCERLDQVSSEPAAIAPLLEEYRQIVDLNTLSAELSALPSAATLQVQVARRLTEQRVRDGARNDRFQQVFQEFMLGIGHQPGSTPAEQAQRYAEAEERYHRPFFDRLPFILENYLLNTIYRTLFPLGREGTEHSILEEYILMATQFAWLNALLIGVAGCYKEAFSDEHVVRVVQSFSRAIEHYPHVLIYMHACVKSLQLDNLNGMAVLLKP